MGRGDRGPDLPGKSQVAISFLKNSGTDPPREAIKPRSNCLLRKVHARIQKVFARGGLTLTTFF